MEKYLREPVNGLTHLIGAVLSVAALTAMIIKTLLKGDTAVTVISVCVFGISMILLYTASSLYHSIISSDKVIKALKRFDHSMIAVLIAGSYAPFCLAALHNKTGYILFAAVGGCALASIIFKLFWVTCPRWISSVMYIAMGWFAAFAIYPLMKVLSPAGLAWLVAGGVVYTIGGIIYALKKWQIKIGPFGNHEIFHLFIMAGTLCHFICVFFFVL